MGICGEEELTLKTRGISPILTVEGPQVRSMLRPVKGLGTGEHLCDIDVSTVLEYLLRVERCM